MKEFLKPHRGKGTKNGASSILMKNGFSETVWGTLQKWKNTEDAHLWDSVVCKIIWLEISHRVLTLWVTVTTSRSSTEVVESMGYLQLMNLKTLPRRNGGENCSKCASWGQSETFVQLQNYSKSSMQYYGDDTVTLHLLFIFVILYKDSGCRGKTYSALHSFFHSAISFIWIP